MPPRAHAAIVTVFRFLPWGISFGLATAFFWPALAQGKVFVGSPDLFHINLPLLLHTQRQIAQGIFSAWNSQIFSGSSIFSFAIVPILSPETWLSLALAGGETTDAALLRAWTWLAWFKIGLSGVLAYYFSQAVLEIKPTESAPVPSTVSAHSTIAALTLLLSGYMQWALTTDSLSLLVLLLVACTALLRGRKIALVVWLCCIFLVSNLLYGAYALFGFAVFAIAKNQAKRGLACAAAAIGLTAWRWLPAVVEILASNRLASVPSTIQDYSWLGLRLLVPELFAFHYADSSRLLHALAPSPQASFVHTHSFFPQFFVPAVLVLAALCFRRSFADRSYRFAFFVGVLSICLALGSEPVFSFARALFGNGLHRPSLQLLIAFAVLWLICETRIQDLPSLKTLSFRSISRIAWGFCGVVAAALCLVLPRLSPRPTETLALLATVTLAPLAVFHLLRRRVPLFCFLALAIGVADLRASPSLASFEIFESTVLWGALRVVVILCAMLECFALAAPRPRCIAVIALSVASLFSGFHVAREHQSLALKIPFEAMPIYSQLPAAQTLPKGAFRVLSPNLASTSRVYSTLEGGDEAYSSQFLLAGLSSFGGYGNSLPSHYFELLQNFSAGRNSRHARLANGWVAGNAQPLTDRALDLLGVSHEWSSDDGIWKARPDFLSRFGVFTKATVANTAAESLKNLLEPGWNPAKSLVLLAPKTEDKPTPERPWLDLFADGFSQTVVLPSAGFAYFGDVYHPGWQVFVDGQPRSVWRANHAFMAVPVSAGKHHIVWRFCPKGWALGQKISLLSLVLTLVVLVPLRSPLRRRFAARLVDVI